MIRISRPTAAFFVPMAIGLVGFAVSASQSIPSGLPVPAVHDEFSYLLAADTFLHGRCANAPHPLWQAFESIHILQQPTYASKYPPGQGLFLALGWQLGGHPVVGVWLGIGLACAAISWMLRGWLPAGWAAGGGLLAALQLGSGEWGRNYWGGGVAAAAGALFLGGWVRVLRKPRRRDAIVMSLGLVLLAISRPFEGLLLCLPVASATVIQLRRRKFTFRVIARELIAPALVVLLPAALALAYYNARVTGDPLRLPYLEHARQYSVAPVLVLQSPRPEPEYRHEVLREFYTDSEYATYRSEHTYEGWSLRVKAKLQMWLETYLGGGLALPLLVLPMVLLLSPGMRLVTAICVFVFGFVATLETWGFSHYTAPAAGLVYLLVAECLRCIALLRWRSFAFGRYAIAIWFAACVLVPDLSRIAQIRPPDRPWAILRAKIEDNLRADGNRHLVVVRYGPRHRVHEEWVYNAADIDGSKVIWARAADPGLQKQLLDYFADRRVWLLEDNGAAPRLTCLRDPQAFAAGARPGNR